MSEEQSMSVKAYLDVGGGKYEVRRFGLPEAMATNFTCLKEKISGVFSLSGQPIILFWKDNENDDITISCDEELMEAIADSVSRTSTNLFRIYIQIGTRPDLGPNNSLPGSESGAIHEGIVCDGCEGPIRGFRYRCMHCKDFDLCAACEHKGKHHEHRVMRLPKPEAKGGPKFWWRENCGPAGNFSTSFGVNAESGGNTFSQSSSSSTSGAGMGWGEGPNPGFRGRRGRRGHGFGRGRGWGGWFGRPWGGAWMGGFGCPPGPNNMPGTPPSTSQNQQQNTQKEDSQKQKQQQTCGNSNTGSFSNEECSWNEESCPFMEAQDAAEFSEEMARESARVAEESSKIAEEVAAQASQFASQMASQMASEHVANVMKGIWTAWSGQEGTQARAAAGTPLQSDTPGSNDRTETNKTQADNNSGTGSQADAYLRTIGNTVASMLDPLGIDVEVSVDHNGIRQRCADGPGNSGNKTTTCTSAGTATATASTSTATASAPVAGTATQTPPRTPIATATQTPIVAAMQTTQMQQTNTKPTVTVPSSEDSSRSSSQEPEQMEVTAPTNIQEIEMEADHSSDNEWTMVNENQVAGPTSSPSLQGAHAKSPQNVNYPNLAEFRPSTPRHPNPVIQRAVEQMLAMGYNNEDGWLTQLLEAKHGDINKVLDLLQPAKKN